MALKAVIHTFQAHPRSQGTKKIECRKEVINSPPPLESSMKNPELNCKTSTEHIDKVKVGPKSYKDQLSSVLKSLKNALDSDFFALKPCEFSSNLLPQGGQIRVIACEEIPIH